MEISKNDQGQTVIRLSEEEWSEYGEQAGYLKKEAMSPMRGTIDGFSDKDEEKIINYVETLKSELDGTLTKLAESCQALVRRNIPYFEKIGVLASDGKPVETKDVVIDSESDMWAKYPNLKALHDSDEMIPPFDKATGSDYSIMGGKIVR